MPTLPQQTKREFDASVYAVRILPDIRIGSFPKLELIKSTIASFL